MRDDLVERWWNGTYGRLARQDARLFHKERWTVELCDGGPDGGRVKLRHFASEDEARAFLAHCLETGSGNWQQLTTPQSQ